jgi:plasmid stabilization system protein ParE
MNEFRFSPEAQTQLDANLAAHCPAVRQHRYRQPNHRQHHSSLWLLARHPYMGRQREDLGSGVRSFPTGDYVIVHRNDSEDGAVLISFVFHGSQDIESFFFIRKPFKTPTPPSINK